MESSILTSTKKVLGIADSYEVFDLDIITQINAAFSYLTQLGVGPTEGFFIEDSSSEWEELNISPAQTALVRTYVFLKTQMYFDPPTLSFLIEMRNNQITELEWRLTNWRDWENDPTDPMTVEVVLDEEVI